MDDFGKKIRKNLKRNFWKVLDELLNKTYNVWIEQRFFFRGWCETIIKRGDISGGVIEIWELLDELLNKTYSV